MPHCMGFGCSNHSGRLSGAIKLFPFPRDRMQARQWVVKMGTDVGNIESFLDKVSEDKKGNKFRLCSEHFSRDQFKRDLQAELTGTTPKQMLIDNAVPSVFGHKQQVQPRSSSESVLAKLDRKRRLSSLLNPLPPKRLHAAQSETTTTTTTTELCTAEPEPVISVTPETVFDGDKDVDVPIRTHVSTGCQTDWCLDTACEIDYQSVRPLRPKKDFALQWPEFEENYEADQNKVVRDHGYSVRLTSSPLVSSRKKLFIPSTFSPVKEDELEISLDMVDDPKDVSYTPSDINASDSDINDSDAISDDSVHDHVHDRKFIVFESCLESLINKVACPHIDSEGQICGKPIIGIKKGVIGTLLKVTTSCLEGHTSFEWNSQPSVNGIPAGNLLSSAATLFSGLTYTRVSQFLGFLGVEFISSSAFYDHQRDYLFPVINLTWKNMQDALLADVKHNMRSGEVKISGDGQCDSPGYSAKYCAYTMMDMFSGKVLDFNVVQVTECSSSVGMEKEGFIRCLQYLSTNGVDISVIATDRHPSIAKYMRENVPDIRHQFDVWHFVKSVKKKLHAAAIKRNNVDLSPWEQSISNHLWWSSQTCGSSAIMLREKWRSVVHHITGIHAWSGFREFHACAHPVLTPDQSETKKWLEPGCDGHEALKKIVFDTRLDKDLEKLTEFCHTGSLEVFHSTCTLYRPKRLHFTYNGMVARTALAAITHNSNCDTKQATVTRQTSVTGQAGELRYKIVFPKSKKEWVAKPIFEETNYSHIYPMLIDVLRMRQGSLTPEINEGNDRSVPKNIAPVGRPVKADLIQKHVSRFGSKTPH